MLAIVGCSYNKSISGAFVPSQSALESRQRQSRLFETKDETALLAAGIAVLQDMGFVVDETEKAVGLVVASKDASAVDASDVVGSVILSMLLGDPVGYDKSQNIRCSLITSPSRLQRGGYYARIVFQRIVTDSEGHQRVETIKDPDIYADFFEKLAKSVFLEAHEI